MILPSVLPEFLHEFGHGSRVVPIRATACFPKSLKSLKSLNVDKSRPNRVDFVFAKSPQSTDPGRDSNLLGGPTLPGFSLRFLELRKICFELRPRNWVFANALEDAPTQINIALESHARCLELRVA